MARSFCGRPVVVWTVSAKCWPGAAKRGGRTLAVGGQEQLSRDGSIAYRQDGPPTSWRGSERGNTTADAPVID